MKKPSKEYVNNKGLLEELTVYKQKYKAALESNSALPRIPEYIGKCILLIANNLIKKPNFSGYSYREDMISDGIETCVKYLHNFDETRFKNPFAYFTQIVKFSFIQRIQKEQKQHYLKTKSLEHSLLFDSLATMSEDNTFLESVLQNSSYGNIANKYVSDNLKESVENKQQQKRASPKSKIAANTVSRFIVEDE